MNDSVAVTPSSFIRFFRRCRSVLWAAFFLVVVGLAVVVGVGRALTPYASHLHGWLEHRISQELSLPVVINDLKAEWHGLTPRLDLFGLRIGEESSLIELEHVRLRADLFHLMLPRRDDWALELSGLQLTLEHGESGWRVRGLTSNSDEPMDYRALLKLGDIAVYDSHLLIADENGERSLALDEVLLHQVGDGLQMTGGLRLSEASTVDVRLQIDDGGVQAYLNGANQPLATWLRIIRPDISHDLSGLADLEVWLRAGPEDAGRLTASLYVDEMDSSATAAPAIEGWAANIWLGWESDRWQLTMADLMAVDSLTPKAGWLRIDADEDIAVAGDHLDLNLLGVISRLWPDLPDAVSGVTLNGILRDISARVTADGKVEHLTASIDGFNVPVREGLPGCEDLAGSIRVKNGQGQLALTTGSLVIPHVFNNPLPVEQFLIDFEWYAGENSWQVNLPRLYWDTGAFQLKAKGRYSGGEQPWLEMSASIPELTADNAVDFLPLGIMSERTGQWLRTGLRSGRLHSMDVVLQGNPKEWPFDERQGQFVAEASLDDITLAFNNRWPLIKNLDGILTFTPKQMKIREARANFGGASIQHLKADMLDMDNAVLEMDISSRDDAGKHLQMLGRLPIDAGSWVADTELSLTGPSAIHAALDVDFRGKRSTTRIDGEVNFDQIKVNYKERIELTRLEGGFRFDDDGLHPSQLNTVWQGSPAHLDFMQKPFRVGLSGHFPMHNVLQAAGVDDFWAAYVQGQSWWQWELTPNRGGTHLQASSDLVGVAISLPDPVAKLPIVPVSLRVDIPFSDRTLVELSYGERVQALFGLGEAGSVNALDIRFGDQAAAPPLPRVARIGGRSASMDMIGWSDVVQAVAADSVEESPATSLLWEADAKLERMQLLGRHFSEVRMQLARSGEHWGLDLSGEQILGRVRMPAGNDASNTVVAEFERLHLPPPPEGYSAASTTDPRLMPALHLYAEDLRWDDWQVGKIQVQAFPVENGLRFETIEADNPMLHLSGQGDWLMIDDEVVSQVHLRMDAEQLGVLLESMGYAALVEGGQTMVEVDGVWPGGPADFALARLEGSLGVSVVQGRFPEAGPGAGRMLGLISVQALPRRILLDFRDVFETGLNFDSLEGEFHLHGGYAETAGLEIDATAAKIVIQGRTDLVRREYDQLVSIRPGVGSTLPIIGAIAGGPVGATAGLALQGILQKPLGGLAEVTYRVTGSWDDPQVEDVANNTHPPAMSDHNGDSSTSSGQGAD